MEKERVILDRGKYNPHVSIANRCIHHSAHACVRHSRPEV